MAPLDIEKLRLCKLLKKIDYHMKQIAKYQLWLKLHKWLNLCHDYNNPSYVVFWSRYIFTQKRFLPGKHKNLMDACLSRYCQVIACNYPPIALWHFMYLTNLSLLIDFYTKKLANFDLLKSHYCFYARLTRSFFSAY